MNLEDTFTDVRNFHLVFGHQAPKKPVMLDDKLVNDRAGFMDEEIQEFRDAKTLTEQADAMIDLIYFALGTLVAMCVRPGVLWQLVHGANMSKVWPDGKVRKRGGDGKTMKPPGWTAPDAAIEREIARQLVM